MLEDRQWDDGDLPTCVWSLATPPLVRKKVLLGLVMLLRH
jgi:hypothetical protein